MMSFLINAAAFIVAIGTLVTFHEFGHYWVARKLGVKVLRFSVGFGRPLWKKRAGADETEYVVAAIPLGGYVKMLDEREGEVDEADVHRAFNRQNVWRRIAIVAAGPLANFLLAIIAYWIMFMAGVNGLKPVIGEIAPDSVAARGGLVAGDEIPAVNGRETPTWQITGITLIGEALEAGRVELKVDGQGGGSRYLTLDLSDTEQLLGEGDLFGKIGITPWRLKLDPVLGKLIAGAPAELAGLQTDDRILTADGVRMESWADWVEYVRGRPEQAIVVEADRNGRTVEVTLTTEAHSDNGVTVGRIGAYPHVDEAQLSAMRVTVRYGPLTGLSRAVVKTWEISALTVRLLWKLVTGVASVKNISGPITIAQFAGVSAVIGLSAFLGALALFSISIGILNLLPVPVLDGGHLLYYFIELIKGSPVSEATEAIGQRVGLAMLAGLMALAFYNDFARLMG